MATKPISTAKVFLVTSKEPTEATLTKEENVITWNILSAAGQTTVIVPAGSTLELSSPSALLSPLPSNFNFALGAGNGSIGGESSAKGDAVRIIEGTAPELTFQNATWNILSEAATSCRVHPSPDEQRVLTMQLILTPTAVEQLGEGWLTVPEGTELIWPFGEAILAAPAHTYIVTLLQLSPQKIIATLATVFAS